MQSHTCLIDTFRLSACARELPLAGWYAEPLEARHAEALLVQARGHVRQAYAGGSCAFGGLLQQLIARFWLGRGIEQEAASLLATAQPVRERALVELVHGQLLLSVRQRAAPAHLAAGFRLAADLLSPQDYFILLKRHEWLHALPLQIRPLAAQGLQQLLIEAGVIRRLRGSRGERPRSTEGAHLDTLG